MSMRVLIPNSDDFQKCGEIMTCSDLEKKTYAFNCIFCKTFCMQFEKFVLHIDEKHQEQLSAAFAKGNETVNIKKELHCAENSNDECTDEREMCDETNGEIVNTCSPDPLIVSIKTEESELKPETESIAIETGMHGIGNDDEECSSVDTEEDGSEKSEQKILKEETSVDFNNKKLILIIIRCLKKRRLLWHDNKPSTRNCKRREEGYKKTAHAIKTQLGLDYDWQRIRECIVKMRQQYRSHVLKQQNNGGPAKQKCETPWYCDKLAFLQMSDTKVEQKKSTPQVRVKEPELPLSGLTDTETIQFIEIYEQFPSLWNVEHAYYRFTNRRQKTFSEMLETVNNKMHLNLTLKDLEHKINRIRNALRREKSSKLPCEASKCEFKSESKFYKNIEFLNDHVGPFKCELCEKITHTADSYKMHKSQHDGTAPFTCSVCHNGFNEASNLTTHMRRHIKDYKFECEVCGKGFVAAIDHKVHMRLHTGEKAYFCEICGKSMRTWKAFDCHMRRHQKRPLSKCSLCAKEFYDSGCLKEHMNVHLNVRDEVCNICGKEFTKKKYLRQHKLIHAEKKRYVCRICNKEFAQCAGLSGHMKSHGTSFTRSVPEEKL